MKKLLLVAFLLLAALFTVFAPRLYRFIFIVDPCYDASGYGK